MASEIKRFEGSITERTRTWIALPPGDLKRNAARAARDRDPVQLWSLTESWLCTYGKAGARVSPKTLESYEVGVRQVLAAASAINLLEPPRDWGAGYVRTLEDPQRVPKPMSASSVRVRLAAARALWSALRWSGATQSDPFEFVHPAKDPTPAWEKRQPYQQSQLEALLDIAEPRERLILLLGGHAGLRIAESCALVPEDVSLEQRQLRSVRAQAAVFNRWCPLFGNASAASRVRYALVQSDQGFGNSGAAFGSCESRDFTGLCEMVRSGVKAGSRGLVSLSLSKSR